MIISSKEVKGIEKYKDSEDEKEVEGERDRTEKGNSVSTNLTWREIYTLVVLGS